MYECDPLGCVRRHHLRNRERSPRSDRLRQQAVRGGRNHESGGANTRAAGGLNPMEPLQLSQTVMDEYAVRILMGTFERPVSALEPSRPSAIPSAPRSQQLQELQA